ncbi:DUF3500 domain-containing protein [Consotaella aegiceratis]|uniref:DUF3500 domain-containing protein n=1 Tax=Consotaella aegiceratis TaxID=3097961 RepID=UPI002F42702E
MSNDDFRDFIFPPETPRIALARQADRYAYSKELRETSHAKALVAEWQRRLAEPFRGITPDGKFQEGLFELGDEGFDVEPAVRAAQAMLETLDDAQRARMSYAIDAEEWRAWYNPEIVFNDNGIRLEDTSEPTRDAFLALLRSCASSRGYEKVLRLLSANLYLGEIYDCRHIMNQWSYHVLMFGEPSATEPWGWSLYGHHAAFNCFVLGRQMVISPTFMGVEPNVIDRGDGNAFTLFTEEERLGLELMQSLPEEMRERATVYKRMEDPAMPPERFNFADQRHFGGAFQDNRIVPLEGVRASEFSAEQRDKLLECIETFLEHWPDAPRAARMEQIESHLDETWWSWIGGCSDDDPFYFRIQSPVIMIEFDHHSGMWLSNKEPAKFHIHTITRIPNGNDYGKALLRLHEKRGR